MSAWRAFVAPGIGLIGLVISFVLILKNLPRARGLLDVDRHRRRGAVDRLLRTRCRRRGTAAAGHPGDLSTARPLPWRDRVAHVIADIHHHDGGPLGWHPRSILRSTIDRLRDAGIEAFVGVELEFYLPDETGRPYQTRLGSYSLENAATGCCDIHISRIKGVIAQPSSGRSSRAQYLTEWRCSSYASTT